MSKTTTDRKMRRLYALLLALALAVFALTNVCAMLADKRFGLSLDMTADRLYELSGLTQEVCRSLTAPITVYVVSAKEDYPAMLREMLDRYARLGGHVTVEYVDPYANPVFLEHYAQTGLTLGAADLLVEGDKRSKVVPYDTLLMTDAQGSVTGIDVEQQLTSALLYVSSEAMPEAVFLTGHNERPTTALRRLFESNSFALRDEALLTGEVGEASIVVVAAPTQDYAPEELEKLERYLAEGGKLMAFLEPAAAALPNLEAFLAGWGIVAENDLVFEPTASAAGNPLNLIPMYASHAINAYFAEHPVYAVMPSARSLTLSAGAQAVLYSTSDAYRKRSVQYTTSQREAEDEAGSVVLAAVAERSAPDGQTAMVFAAGSRMLYADDLMNATTYANSLFLSQVVSYLYHDVQTISIAPKTLSTSPLPITYTQSLVWGAALVIVLPLGVLAAGIVVCYRRKRL